MDLLGSKSLSWRKRQWFDTMCA